MSGKPRRLVPVDAIDVDDPVKQASDDCPVLLQVEDVRPINQRVDNEYRNVKFARPAYPRLRRVVEEFEFVLHVDDVAGVWPTSRTASLQSLIDDLMVPRRRSCLKRLWLPVDAASTE